MDNENKAEDKKAVSFAEETLENKLIVKKEAMELARACGYIAGEAHEVTKDGVGPEDMKSAMDLVKNYPILKDGFKIQVKMNRKNLDQLTREDLMGIVLATFGGFKEGAE